MERYEELARQATWVASKVSSDVHGVDTMVGHLAEGRFKIGAGDTAVAAPEGAAPAMATCATDGRAHYWTASSDDDTDETMTTTMVSTIASELAQ